ncbi:MAG: hypothetical protein HYX83_02340 [Chloroflexi bacterium]|nr:hypothetical protein [Chloroflexota bacterium]
MVKPMLWLSAGSLSLILVAGILAGCGGGTSTEPTTTSPTTTSPTTTGPQPTIKIVNPEQAGVYDTKNIEVRVEVTNFTLVSPADDPTVAADKGHIHYYLDVDIPATVGKPAVTPTGTYKATHETSVVWENVPRGEHAFGVQLVRSDHTPLSPPFITRVYAWVAVGEPAKTPSGGAGY